MFLGRFIVFNRSGKLNFAFKALDVFSENQKELDLSGVCHLLVRADYLLHGAESLLIS
jgi:hypothetical protein